MNTFWLKVAGIVVIVVIVIVLISKFSSSNRQPATEQEQPRRKPEAKTVYDTFNKDEENLGIEYEQGQAAGKSRQTPPPRPTEQIHTQPASPPRPTFRKLTLQEEVEAQKLFEMAKAQRKMGRLPMMGYKKMVDYCREIIQRWPDSEYAFQAKRMLADIPPRYHEMYNITEDELDLSSFYPTSD
jgi:type IV secretory pathway VirB10-like protein